MGIPWRDMAVQNLPSGQPTMTPDRLGGRAAGDDAPGTARISM